MLDYGGNKNNKGNETTVHGIFSVLKVTDFPNWLIVYF